MTQHTETPYQLQESPYMDGTNAFVIFGGTGKRHRAICRLYDAVNELNRADARFICKAVTNHHRDLPCVFYTFET